MTSLLFYPDMGPAVLTLAELESFIIKYDKLKRWTTVYLFTVKVQLNSLGAEMLRNIWRQIMASPFLQYLIDTKRFILENSNSASKTIIEYGMY
jgi:hypothetical protein